ncbi:hypothetical protein ACIOK4_13760 [Streptomyces bottropensis]|uniref:hypothetical protein n=1 Tax=Streptomyces bottropensis TaxID=42235 RepID=UPI0037FAD234
MSVRRQIIAALSEDSLGGIATLADVAHAEQMVDAHRTEVLAKAVGRLRAIPVDCTALTGPVWYGDGWNSAITVLEEIAEYQTPDDEAYPGELQRLRATVLALHVAALRKEDLTEAQRVLNEHEDWRKEATAAAATATPDFFQPGRSYVSGTWQFRCEAITPSPGTGEIRALGWKRAPVHDVHLWHAAALDPDDWAHGGWADITKDGSQ